MCDDCPKKSKDKLRKLLKWLEEDDTDNYDMPKKSDCKTAVSTFGITNTVSPVTSISLSDVTHLAQTCAVMSNSYIPFISSSNCEPLINPASNILLLTYHDNTVLTMAQFQQLFYSSDTFTFCPNPSCYNVNRLKLNNYMILTSAGFVQFSLYDQMITAYCNANSVNPNDISPTTKMNLVREVQACQSLALIKGSCDSLTLDQCYQSLYASDHIKHVDTAALNAQYETDCSMNEMDCCSRPKTNVLVNMQVILEIVALSINTKLSIIIRYPTIIPDNIASSTQIGIFNLQPTISADIHNMVQSVTGISNVEGSQQDIEDL